MHRWKMHQEAKMVIRARHWAELLKKIEERGKLDNRACALSKVNYKQFIKPKIVKSKHRKRKTNRNINCSNKINVSDIIDEDEEMLVTNTRKPVIVSNVDDQNTNEVFVKYIKEPSTLCSESKEIDNSNCKTGICGSYNLNCLKDLIYYIEVDLKSNLKETLTKRSESKILETNDYSFWHDSTKEEMGRLRKYITAAELKEYMKYCNESPIKVNSLNDIIVNQMKSDIKRLLVKRESVRNDNVKCLQYRKQIYDEWQKLLNHVNINSMILYASGLINSTKMRKLRMSLPTQHKESLDCKIFSRSSSSDSGISSANSIY